VTCFESGSVTIGSIGSNANQPDYVENVLVDGVSLNRTWNQSLPRIPFNGWLSFGRSQGLNNGRSKLGKNEQRI
jgi:hypothetical protein